MGKLLLGDDIVLPKESGKGILVDHTAPTYAWRDIIGDVHPKASGVGSPARAAIQGNVAAYAFALNDVCDFTFHIPHDYAPGTDIYWHIHWLHNGTNISGTMEFTNYVSYAKGHNQANYPAEVAPLITYDTVNLTTTPQYRHRIDEIQLSASSPSATQIDTDDLEPDGMLLITMKLTTIPTITAGNLFVLHGDLHYQSTSTGTKQKAPSPTFWS